MTPLSKPMSKAAIAVYLPECATAVVSVPSKAVCHEIGPAL